jgi:hypothetical protein
MFKLSKTSPSGPPRKALCAGAAVVAVFGLAASDLAAAGGKITTFDPPGSAGTFPRGH